MSESAPNEKQAEYWNGVAGAKWVAKQEALDAQIGPLGLAMLDRAQIVEGDRVLDAGCGCGGTTLEIAMRVGAGGHVTGADLSRPMLGRARERASESGLKNVDFIQADAQTHDFGALDCDLLASRFGVMFFADPTTAFANLRSALKNTGRLVFVCWRTLQENPWMTLPLMAAAKHIELPPPPGPEEPGPFSFADPDRVHKILEDAGFTSIEIDPDDRAVPLDQDGLEADVASRFEIGPLSRIIQDATDDQRELVRGSVREALAPYYEPEGPTMMFASWIVAAKNVHGTLR